MTGSESHLEHLFGSLKESDWRGRSEVKKKKNSQQLVAIMKITIPSILNSKGVSKQAKGEAAVDWGHSDFKITKLANELSLATYSSCFILNFQP